jgi:hypothetical protein
MPMEYFPRKGFLARYLHRKACAKKDELM